MNIFERASRKKLRFDTPVGELTVEDLWDLDLTRGRASLDSIAAKLHGLLQVPGNFSLVNPDQVTASQSDNQLRFDIVKHVVEDKLARQKAAEASAAKRAKRDQLLAVMARKQDEAISSASLEDLQKQLDELDADEPAEI